MGITRSFNPRARDGREKRARAALQLHRCFNPRARDGRENIELLKEVARHVSIHAPVMDANC